ncbi:beta strand repeat-containing protein, partial [Variovorax soli]|nr:autotransporter adhesin [Variovorax soli]
TDAVNGSQLFATNQAIEDVATTAGKGWNLSANGVAGATIKAGDTVDFANGKNITVTQSGNQISVATVDTPSFTSVTTGGTVINNTGLTIAGGPSVTTGGIDAGGKVIGNVAAGVNATDAVNVSQLNALSGNAVQYDDAGKTTITLNPGGTTSTKITNLTAGDLSANSTDAVNGSQLFATNTNVTNLGDTVTNINDKGTKYFHANSVGADSQAIGTDAVAIGQNAVANNANDVALGANASTAAAVGTAGATIAGTAYNFAGAAPVGTVSVGSAGAERTITNVAAGQLSASSTDAVNGSQLFATNQAIDGLTTNAVQYDDASKSTVTLNPGGTTSTKITNLAAGDLSATSTDAVNGSQLFATNTNVTNLGDTVTNINDKGTKYFHANSIGADSQAIGTDAVAVGVGAVAGGLNAVAMGNGATAQDVSSIALGNGSSSSKAYGVAIGDFASTSGLNAVALGSGAIANGDISSAIGYLSEADGKEAVAMGASTRASGRSAVAIGLGAAADTVNTIAVGNAAQASGENAISIGAGNVANGDNAIALGAGAQALGTGAISIGTGNIVNGNNSGAIGDPNTINANQAYALGNNNLIDAGADGSFVVGNNSAVNTGATGALVMGSNAVIAANVIDAMALGNNTSVSANNSVALGANSVANGTGLLNPAYNPNVAAVIAGTAPVGEVSVGAAGGERRITNVAAGSGDTDAVNVSQLRAVSGVAGNAVQYDDASKTTVTLNPGGTTSTKITNLAAGDLSATSTDAVNGSQLFATNTNVTNLGDTVTNINDKGTKYFHANSIGADSQAIGTDAVAIGQNAVANNANDVALGANASTAAAVGTAGATIAGTAYNFAGTAPVGTVSVGSAGAERTITNVAAGRVTAASTDAVNGSQLFATNQAIDGLTTNAVQYDDASKSTVTLNPGGTATTIHNVADGALANDAVNFSQLTTATNKWVTGNPTTYVAPNSTGTDSTAIGSGAESIGQNSVALGNNSFDGGQDNVVSVGSVGAERRITNVAPGTADTDAVNISQLNSATKYFNANSTQPDSLALGADSVAVGPLAFASNVNAIAMGNGAQATGKNAISIGTGNVVSGNNSGAFGDPSIIDGANSYSVGNNNSIDAGSTDVFVLGNNVNVGAGLTGAVVLGSGSAAAAANATTGDTIGGKAYTYAGTTPTNTVSVGAAGAERQITNVAAGRVSASSTDAVNGSQLFATNQAIDGLTTNAV